MIDAEGWTRVMAEHGGAARSPVHPPAKLPAARQPAPRKQTAATKTATKTGAKTGAKTATAKTAAAKTAATKTAATKTATTKTATTKTATTKTAATKTATTKTATTKRAATRAPAPKPAAPKQAVTKASARAATKRAAKKPAAVQQPTAPPRVAAGDEDWTAAEITRIRTELGRQAAELRAEIDGSAATLRVLQRDSAGDGSGDDQADAGSKTFEREQEMSLANNSRHLLAQVERALDRLDDGSYGSCESCGQPIAKARLQAFPRATLCVSCKQREERR